MSPESSRAASRLTNLEMTESVSPARQTSTRPHRQEIISSAAAQSLTIELIDTPEGFDALEPAWNELCDSADSSIFQTWAWNRIWWKHFGKPGELSILRITHRSDTIAILPLFRDSVQLAGRTCYQALRFIGSNVTQPTGRPMLGLIPYTDYLDIIVRPGFENTAIERLGQWLENLPPHIDEVIFESLPATSPIRAQLPLLKSAAITFRTAPCATHQVVDLPDDWEAYLMSLSKNSRSHARRALKKIEQADKRRFRLEVADTPPILQERFDEMVRIHQSRWNRLGQLGTFAERRNLKFHREVAMAFCRQGSAEIRSLFATGEERPVAIDLNYRFKGKLYGIHCAVDDRSLHYQEGPGTSLIYSTLKDAVTKHYRHFDFLRGEEPYKQVMANRREATLTLMASNRGSGTSRRAYWIKRLMRIKRRATREWLQANVQLRKQGVFHLMRRKFERLQSGF